MRVMEGVVHWKRQVWHRHPLHQLVQVPPDTILKVRRAAAPPMRRTPAQMELEDRGAPARLPPRSVRGPSRVSRPWVASRRHRQPP